MATRREFPGGRILRLTTGDITRLKADVIVNAANSALRGGGGVDAAIHRAAGPAIMRELDAIRAAHGGCPTGSAVVTSAGGLPARFVFHAVGPIYQDGRSGEAELLASCYRTAMRLADERGVAVITFPSISTGVYGYPVEEAGPIAVSTVAAHLASDETSILEAIFVLFDQRTYDAYADALDRIE